METSGKCRLQRTCLVSTCIVDCVECECVHESDESRFMIWKKVHGDDWFDEKNG